MIQNLKDSNFRENLSEDELQQLRNLITESKQTILGMFQMVKEYAIGYHSHSVAKLNLIWTFSVKE